MTKLFTEYPEAWQSMLDDCAAAKEYIYFEHFIWKNFGVGEIGKRFLEVFKQKVAEGVRVRLIIDTVGSIGLYTSPFLQKEITDAGIELSFFGLVPRWKSLFPFNLFHRDHRKILIVDDRVSYVGGVIISQEASGWEDIAVRITDTEYIREIKGAFLRLWDEIRGSKEHFEKYDLNTNLILKNNPEHNDLYKEILHRIKHAQKKISIVTPYLSPDWKIMRALKKARKRGLPVEIILPKRCDSWVTAFVAQSYLRQLYRYKIDVYHYQNRMNHGKMVIVDDWATLGSMNFDRLSFFYNRELNVVFQNDLQQYEDLVKRLKSCSNKMERAYFTNKGFVFKIQSLIGKLLRPIA